MEGYIQCQHYQKDQENEVSASTIKNSGHVTFALILGFILQSLIDFMIIKHVQGVQIYLLKVLYSTTFFFIIVPIVIIVKTVNVLEYLKTRLRKMCSTKSDQCDIIALNVVFRHDSLP